VGFVRAGLMLLNQAGQAGVLYEVRDDGLQLEIAVRDVQQGDAAGVSRWTGIASDVKASRISKSKEPSAVAARLRRPSPMTTRTPGSHSSRYRNSLGFLAIRSIVGSISKKVIVRPGLW